MVRLIMNPALEIRFSCSLSLGKQHIFVFCTVHQYALIMPSTESVRIRNTPKPLFLFHRKSDKYAYREADYNCQHAVLTDSSRRSRQTKIVRDCSSKKHS